MNISTTLEKLITFKTITGNTEECRQLFDWIQASVAQLSVFQERMTFNGFESLVITTQQTKSPILWLAAHIDVVPAPNHMFTPTREGNILRGRGVVDMKFAVACYLQLFYELGKDLCMYDIGLMFTSDEEIGGFSGTKKVLEAGYDGKAAFLPDGGVNGEVINRARGVCHIRVKSVGAAAHGSRPWLGENAIDKLADFLLALRTDFQERTVITPDHFHCSLNVGVISGGEKTNSVPEHAEASVDIRFTSQGEKEDIKKRISEISSEFPGITTEVLLDVSELVVPPENLYIQQYIRSFARQYGKEPMPGIDHGASDASFFNERGIPVVIAKPIGGDQHSQKEWVDLADLQGNYYATLKKYVLSVAQVQ